MTLVANSPGSPETRDYACLGGPILPRLQPIGSRPEFATSVNNTVMSRKVAENLVHVTLMCCRDRCPRFRLSVRRYEIPTV